MPSPAAIPPELAQGELHVGGLPDGVSFDIHHLETLPLPEADGARQKGMGVQVEHFYSLADGVLAQLAAQPGGQAGAPEGRCHE